MSKAMRKSVPYDDIVCLERPFSAEMASKNISIWFMLGRLWKQYYFRGVDYRCDIYEYQCQQDNNCHGQHDFVPGRIFFFKRHLKTFWFIAISRIRFDLKH
jgi:hypothetical protein